MSKKKPQYQSKIQVLIKNISSHNKDDKGSESF